MDRRRGIFEKNVGIIREANREFDAGRSTYELRVNCFGDLQLEEFAQEYLGLGLLSMLVLRKCIMFLMYISEGEGAPVNEEALLRRASSANRRLYSALPYSIDWAERGNN